MSHTAYAAHLIEVALTRPNPPASFRRSIGDMACEQLGFAISGLEPKAAETAHACGSSPVALAPVAAVPLLSPRPSGGEARSIPVPVLAVSASSGGRKQPASLPFRCGFCGRPSRGPVCRAHDDVPDQEAEMTDDPPVREDGLCVVCSKPRRPERSARYAKGIADLDPFCSNTCARAWWANPVPDKSIWGLTPTSLEEAA